MSEGGRPHLRALDAEGETPGAASPVAAAAPATGGRRGWLPWLLAGVALVCLAGWIWQARSAAELASELAWTERALAASEARVEDLEGYVEGVRERFGSLQETLRNELDALAALLSAEPGSEAAGGDVPETP